MSVGEFVQRPAVELMTGGRYSLASRRDMQSNRREFACRTTRSSPFQMLIAAPVLGPKGERVISYFGELGKLDGLITDTIEGGFIVDIAATRKTREGLATKLSWLEKKQRDAVIDVRKQQRLVPENPHTNLIFGDGTTVSCFVIDVSPCGVAVSADIEPEIGTRLAVGRAVGQPLPRRSGRLHASVRLGEGTGREPGRTCSPALLHAAAAVQELRRDECLARCCT
jgi:hypothetical protein